MVAIKHEVLELRREEQVVKIRHAARTWAVEIGLSLVDQTKLITAASELARNTIIHGGGGTVDLWIIQEGSRRGIRLRFIDQGPGIADVDLALRDGYTTGDGLGLGLGGAKRLVNEFDIQSRSGEGTSIAITRWK